MTQPRPAAWIVDSLRRFDLPGLDQLNFPPAATSAQVWDLTRKATGLTSEALAGHVARHLNLDLADLQAVTAQALQLVPERIARRHHVVPLRQTDRHFFAASADPLN